MHCWYISGCLCLLPLFQMLKPKSEVYVDRHSHSLDDVRLLPPTVPLGTKLPPDSSHSYTFGLQDAVATRKLPINHSHFPTLDCPTKPSFYGHRSSNCLSLDVLSDEQFLEFILWVDFFSFCIFKWCYQWHCWKRQIFILFLLCYLAALHSFRAYLFILYIVYIIPQFYSILHFYKSV